MAKNNYPKLYNSKENTTGIGLGVLRDVKECIVTEERNGIFELNMTYATDGFLAEHLVVGKIIKANASKTLKNQLFRIYDVKKDIKGDIEVNAEHIFFDLKKSFVPRINPGKKVNATTALGLVISNMSSKDTYNVFSDITTTNKFEHELKSALECIMNSEGSLIDSFNGELLRDNNTIYYKKNRGQDRGVHVTYSKNITGFVATENMDSLITGIYPYLLKKKEMDTNIPVANKINGTESVFLDAELVEMDGDKFILAENAGDFDTVFYTGVDFSDDETWNTKAQTPHNLRLLAEKYFDKTKVNILKSVYEVDLIALSNTEEYKKFSFLEDIELCDIVTVNNKKFNIKEKVKVTEIKYNPLLDKIEAIILGGSTRSLSSSINGQIEEIKNKLDTNKTETEKVIENVTAQITGCNGGYVKLYPPHNPSEIYIMNHEDPNQATEVLRMNKKGIGFGRSINGPFSTAWTASGVFNADFIKAGTVSASLIKTGVLKNTSETLAIDLDGSSIDFFGSYSGRLQKTISMKGPNMTFFNAFSDGDACGAVSIMKTVSSSGQEGAYPLIALSHRNNSYMALNYLKDATTMAYGSYVKFDKYGRGTGSATQPVHFYERVGFGSGLVCSSYYMPHCADPIFFKSTNDKHAVRAGTSGLALINYYGNTIFDIASSGQMSFANGYYFSKVKLNYGATSYIADVNGSSYLTGTSGTVLSDSSYKHFETRSDVNISFNNLNMNGNSIVNSRSVNTYADTTRRSSFNTYASQSLQEEVSYTFESRTRGNEIKINLNENLRGITKDDYIIQLTPYANSAIWCKKFDEHFIVYTAEKDVEFSCRVIKKIDNVSCINMRIIDNEINTNFEEKDIIEEEMPLGSPDNIFIGRQEDEKNN